MFRCDDDSAVGSGGSVIAVSFECDSDFICLIAYMATLIAKLRECAGSAGYAAAAE